MTWNRFYFFSILFSLPLLISGTALAQGLGPASGSDNQDHPRTNLLAISQGISSPSVTSGTLISNNFGRDNPVGAAFINSYRTTLELDTGSAFGFGADVAVGDGNYGFSAGYRQPVCDSGLCDGYARGQLGADWSGFGVGLGISEDLFTLGLLFNGRGMNRIGFIVESSRNALLGDHQVYGIGYSFVSNGFTAAVDATYINRSSGNSTIKVSPGVSIRIRDLAVSFNYDTYVQDLSGAYGDHGWFGVGYSFEDEFHFALYANYTNEWTLTGSYFF